MITHQTFTILKIVEKLLINYFVLNKHNTNRASKIRADEKGCKMDVNWRRRASTIDQREKSRMVNIDREKCVVDVDGAFHD